MGCSEKSLLQCLICKTYKTSLSLPIPSGSQVKLPKTAEAVVIDEVGSPFPNYYEYVKQEEQIDRDYFDSLCIEPYHDGVYTLPMVW